MHLAYVVPRYGLDVIGGAELGARMLAEHLVATLGWKVEVFTTCARDASTWRNEYPAATVDVNGVTVHRIASTKGRARNAGAYPATFFFDRHGSSREQQWEWLIRQGPVVPDLVDAVRASSADLVVFYPYLYYPTVATIGHVADRAVMHPAAHDEPPLYLSLYDEVFARPRGYVFQTNAERRLVQRRFAVSQKRHVVLGLGTERPPGEVVDARSALSLGDRPYLCYVGRVDRGKGVETLARFFAAYKRRRPGPLALVIAGPPVHEIPRHPDIVLTGAVDEPTKWGLLRDATAFVHPGAYEAFSIVVIEAWLAGVPVMVNARCAATVEHCRLSSGGIAFDGYAEFEAAVDLLLADEARRRGLAARGRRYVEENFEWPALVERYSQFLRGVRG